MSAFDLSQLLWPDASQRRQPQHAVKLRDRFSDGVAYLGSEGVGSAQRLPNEQFISSFGGERAFITNTSPPVGTVPLGVSTDSDYVLVLRLVPSGSGYQYFITSGNLDIALTSQHTSYGNRAIFYDGTVRDSGVVLPQDRLETLVVRLSDTTDFFSGGLKANSSGRTRKAGLLQYYIAAAGGGLNTIALLAVVPGRLSDADCIRISDEPYSALFEPIHQVGFDFPAGVSGVTGTLSVSETGNDVFAGSGGLGVAGTLSALETGSDAFASSGTVVVAGALSAQETGSDTLSATGVQQVSGTLAASETGSDALTSSGAILVSGNFAAAETGSDTFFAIGGNFASGTLSAQETGDDSFAASVAIAVAGTLAATETGADTLAASGAIKIFGIAAASEAGSDTAAFSGQIIVSGGFAAAESGEDTFQAGSGGYAITFAQAQLLSQIYLLHGLGSPLSVAPTSRAVAGLSQEITSLSGTVTVKTLTQEPALAAPVGAMLEELAALHGLTVDLVVTPTSRTAGGISQAFTTVGSQTTITRQ